MLRKPNSNHPLIRLSVLSTFPQFCTSLFLRICGQGMCRMPFSCQISSYYLILFNLIQIISNHFTYRQVACTLFIPSHISQSTALTSLSNLELSSRVQVVAWFQGNSTFTDAHHYPINALRNAAISVVRTTHYLVIDEGMLLAPSLSTKLNYINKELLHERGTIILPLFFFTRTDHIPPNCIQDMRCVQEYVFNEYSFHPSFHPSIIR